jgi:hypothetical protein
MSPVRRYRRLDDDTPWGQLKNRTNTTGGFGVGTACACATCILACAAEGSGATRTSARPPQPQAVAPRLMPEQTAHLRHGERQERRGVPDECLSPLMACWRTIVRYTCANMDRVSSFGRCDPRRSRDGAHDAQAVGGVCRNSQQSLAEQCNVLAA